LLYLSQTYVHKNKIQDYDEIKHKIDTEYLFYDTKTKTYKNMLIQIFS